MKMVITLNKVNIESQMNELQSENRNRDPGEVNKNVKILWSNVVAEPETLRSPDWVWKASSVVFTQFQLWTYKILTVILGPILAFIIAINFAILGFMTIWCFHPINKYLHIVFSSVRKFFEILSNSIFGPFLETFGLCLSNIKFRHQRIYDAKDEPQYPYII